MQLISPGITALLFPPSTCYPDHEVRTAVAASRAGKYWCTRRLLHLGFWTDQRAACKVALSARCLEWFGCPPYSVRRCSGREHLSCLSPLTHGNGWLTAEASNTGDYVNWNLRRWAPSFTANHPLASCGWIYWGLKEGVCVSASSSLPSKLTPCCDSARNLGCPWWMLQASQPPWQCCQPVELPAARSIPLTPAQPDLDMGLTPLHPVALLASGQKPELVRRKQ